MPSFSHFKKSLFCFLVVCASGAQAGKCNNVHRVVPSASEISAVVRSEFSRNQGKELAARVSRISKGKKSVDERGSQILGLLRQNVFAETNLPLFLLEPLAKDFAEKAQSATEVSLKLREQIEKRRTLYFERQLIEHKAHGRIEPLDIKGYKVSDFKHFEVFEPPRPVSSQELLNLLPSLDRLWPRTFDPQQKQKPRMIVFEIADIPGTYTVMFNDLLFMNNAFQRASVYIEQKKWPFRGVDIFGILAGGHDLKGPDLLRYLEAFKRDHAETVRAQGDGEYQRRIAMEAEFFDVVILPAIQKRGAENTVFLAGAADFGSMRVISHEIWHAKFFTDPHFAQIARNYWERMPSADQDLFKDVAAEFKYDVKDQELMANEFQAYMLNRDDVIPGKTAVEQKMKAMTDKLRPAFLEYLKDQGVAVN